MVEDVFKQRYKEQEPLEDKKTIHQSDVPAGGIKFRHLEGEMMKYGLYADRPSGSTHVKAYYATDTNVLYLWDGDSWEEIGGAGVTIDISDDTNLAVTAPIVLTDDTLSLDQSAVDHGSIGGLADDDHSQYHNDARGDARYYTETELDAGQLDNRYFTETEHINTSAGAADSGKPIKLDAAGHVDATMINDADIDHDNITNTHNLTTDIDHGSISGLADDDHSQYALLAGRSGGQTLIGGTDSGDDLTLQSTSNATKGHVILGAAGNSAYDEVNDRLGLGTASPGNRLEVVGGNFKLIGTNKSVGIYLDNGTDGIEIYGGTNESIIYTTAGDMIVGGVVNTRFRTYESGWKNRLTILNNGNVGIGMTSPDHKLQVDGNIVSETDSTDDLGSSSIYWANVYSDKIYLDADSTIEAADVDNFNVAPIKWAVLL